MLQALYNELDEFGEKRKYDAYLALTHPILDIFDVTSTTDFYEFAWSDEHIARSDDVSDWGFLWIIAS
jgi:hypothetical protein